VWVRFAVMFFCFIGVDMPTTIITTGGFLKTGIAIKRAPKEELLQTVATQMTQVAFFQRQFELVSTAFALRQLCMGDQGREVVMDPLGENALSMTKWAGHPKHRLNGLSDKGTFVGKFVKQICEGGIDLESHYRCFWGSFRHFAISSNFILQRGSHSWCRL
jgi:hypothetical protein